MNKITILELTNRLNEYNKKALLSKDPVINAYWRGNREAISAILTIMTDNKLQLEAEREDLMQTLKNGETLCDICKYHDTPAYSEPCKSCNHEFCKYIWRGETK